MLQTADVDAKIMAEVSLLVCGSSSCFAAVAAMDSAAETMAADVDAMTAVCGSSYCLYSAADVATALAVETADVDANNQTLI